jgi:hypothetical protein
MNVEWVDGSRIKVTIENDTVTISANRQGLLSLSRQLSDLADEENGVHIHYDEYNSLEDDSTEMIIEKSE